MSAKATGYVFDIPDLHPTLKFVLLAYADHADHAGGNIYPGYVRVAAKTGYSRRTVIRAVQELKEMGLLIPDGRGPRNTNRWRLNMDWDPQGVTECHGDRESPVTLCPKRGDSHDTSLGDTLSPESLTVINPGDINSEKEFSLSAWAKAQEVFLSSMKDSRQWRRRFEQTRLLSQDGPLFTVACSDATIAAWMNDGARLILERSLVGIANIPEARIEFVMPEQAERSPA